MSENGKTESRIYIVNGMVCTSLDEALGAKGK